MLPALRDRLAGALAAADHRGAWGAMAAAIAADPTTATCHVVAEALERLDAAAAGLPETRVALLANFTAAPLATILAARAVASGIVIRPHVAPYDAWMPEIFDESSALYRHAPDVVVLALTIETLAPALATGFLGLEPARAAELVADTASTIENAIDRLRRRTSAKVLLHAFPSPSEPALGVIDATRPDGQTSAFRSLNDRLQAWSATQRDVFVVDLDRLVSAIGEAHWRDRRMAVLAGLPYTPAALHAIADEHLRYVRAFCGRVRKVLVLDGDDTLWGGIVGETGVDGVALGDGYPGACFAALQHAVLELRRRGVLLALNSSNNPGDIDEMLAHPRMIVRRDDFAAVRANWDDKAANLAAIADELSLGLDTFVFVDNSAAECERVRSALPEVLTVHLTGDPAAYADRIRSLGVFDTLAYGDDDRERAERYRHASARHALQRDLPTLDAYYTSLQMELTVERIGAATLARAADLTQRTNQFNLAPERFTRDGLAAALAAPGVEGYIFGLRDRFGDYGFIGLAVLEDRDAALRISTLLLSCRVLKRTVEETVLAFIAGRAEDRRRTALEGVFRPSPRNQAAAAFYRDRGFALASQAADGTEIYLRPIDPRIAPSPFVSMTTVAEHHV
jgi:FkbH-like protein